MMDNSLNRAWLLCGFAVVLLSTAVNGEEADALSALYRKVQPSLVIVAAGRASGSGFILVMGGKKYVVTNEHVIRGGAPLSLRLMTGETLRYSAVEVADTLDIVRLELRDQRVVALKRRAGHHTIGTAIAVLGNSDGRGVATCLGGRVLGVGPDRIEVDAGFVQGNSGSPIVDMNGEVLGIATYAVRSSGPTDWLRRGTRFSEVRRFGLKLAQVNWVRMKPKQYFQRADALADLEMFCRDLYELHCATTYVNPKTGLFEYSYAQNCGKYRRNAGLCRLLADAVDTVNPALIKQASAYYYAKEAEMSRVSGRGRNVQHRKDAERNMRMQVMQAKQQREKHIHAYKQIFPRVNSMVTRNKWLASRMRDEALFWLGVVKAIAGEGQ